MNFGYNADAAFAKTTADIIDHTKFLLSSLVDRLKANDVRCRYLMDPRDDKAKLLLKSSADPTYSMGIRLAE